METLNDVFTLMVKTKTAMAIFGSTKRCLAEYEKRVKKIGESICKEKQISLEEAAKLQPETVVLGPQSKELALQFKKWYEESVGESTSN